MLTPVPKVQSLAGSLLPQPKAIQAQLLEMTNFDFHCYQLTECFYPHSMQNHSRGIRVQQTHIRPYREHCIHCPNIDSGFNQDLF